MKKLLSLLLAAALLGALGAPAAATEESTDARLARVTQAVKQTLGLDTSDYEDFQGECYEEELAATWNLRWSSGDRYLRVEALEDGTVTAFSQTEEDDLYRWGWEFPTFPKGDLSADRAAAEEFLAKVLRENESVELDKFEEEESLNSNGRSFNGTILLNGLPAPLSYNISVRNGKIVRFWRTAPENAFIGGIPSPETGVTKIQAAEKLKETLELRLEYVERENEPGQAVLRYVPEDGHQYYVDGVSGELVDLTELEEELSRKYASTAGGDMGAAPAPAAAEDASEGVNGFSSAEQSGIQQMEGVLSKESLDKTVQAITAFGLKGYTLAAASYSIGEKANEEESGKSEVLCTLRYQKPGEKSNWTRTVVVDARTGEVQSVQSYAPWDEAEPALTLEQAQEKAEAFLKTFCPERVESMELYDSGEPEIYDEDSQPRYYFFHFAQKINGYFFPANTYSVFIDTSDGSIYYLSYEWNEKVSFDDAEGIVSEQAALEAWMGTYDVTLGYSQVPQELTGGDAVSKRLTSLGVTHYYGLRLGYTLQRGTQRDGWFYGVDAKSGEPLKQEIHGKAVKTYGDLAGSSAKEAVETLLRYGVGYDCENFRPGKSLTQWDLVCLLYSLDGAQLNPDDTDKQMKEEAYAAAYRMGALERGERNDNAVLTRGQLIKILVNAAGFGDAAQLAGIFTCAYGDKESIPAADMGYAAIAQALGLAEGTYAGMRGTSRGEAAVMIYTLLGRK